MKKTLMLTAILCVGLTIFLSGTAAYAQTDDKPKVRFLIQVYSVDIYQRTAQVNVTLTFENLLNPYVVDSEPIEAILIGALVVERHYLELWFRILKDFGTKRKMSDGIKCPIRSSPQLKQAYAKCMTNVIQSC